MTLTFFYSTSTNVFFLIFVTFLRRITFEKYFLNVFTSMSYTARRLPVVHRFSAEQVDCMCEALLQQYPASMGRLVMLISSLSSSQLQRCDSEHLLRARAVAAFHAGRFTELYAILTTGTHVFDPAHHPLLQKVTRHVYNMISISLLLRGRLNKPHYMIYRSCRLSVRLSVRFVRVLTHKRKA